MTLTFANFEIQDLTSLDPAEVSQVQDRLITQLQEANPALDLKRGVFKDMLVYYHSILETAIRTDLSRYQSARSLQQIEADPTLADDGVVDGVLSNWGITRKIGTKATGSVAIELNQSQSVIVPAGSLFEANGLSYEATETFTARPLATQVQNSTDRILTQLSNGNYAFVIDVEASDVGDQYKLNAGTLVIPNRSIVAYVTSYAVSSFSDGTNTETNSELINELQLGVSAKTLSNRSNMRALLRDQEVFSSVTNQSIVGYGDPEMLRDRHTIFNVSYGGRVDWYIRGQATIQRTSLSVTATLMSVSDTVGTWQFSMGKDVLPGFYEVDKLRRATDSETDGSFTVTLDDRGVDLTGSGFIPDIVTTAEGAYTAYQTATIQFEDTVTDASSLSLGDKGEYVAEITGLPLVAELQSFVGGRDTRSYAADALVKSPVPCFVRLFFEINKKAADAEPDLAGIRTALAEEINGLGFIGRLDGSLLTDVIQNFLTDNNSVTNLDISGRIRNPDGSISYLRDSDSIVVVDRPDRMTTAKTVQFFIEPDDIVIAVKSSIPTAQ